MKPAVVLAWFAFLAGSVSLFAAEKKVPRYEGKPLDYWVKRLQTAENDNDREEAAKALMAFGPDAAPAVPALLVMLDDRSEEFRRGIGYIMREIGPAAKAAVPALIKMLRAKTPRSPGVVISILGSMGPEAKAAVP